MDAQGRATLIPTDNKKSIKGTLTHAGDGKMRHINYFEDSLGRLRGLAKPFDEEEATLRKAMVTEIRKDTFKPQDVPEYSKYGLWEAVNERGVKEHKAGFRVKDVILDGQPLTLYPAEAMIRPSEEDPDTLQGFYMDLDGRAYEIFMQQQNFEGSEAVYYDGTCAELDINYYLAIQDEKAHADYETVYVGGSAMTAKEYRELAFGLDSDYQEFES